MQWEDKLVGVLVGLIGGGPLFFYMGWWLCKKRMKSVSDEKLQQIGDLVRQGKEKVQAALEDLK